MSIQHTREQGRELSAFSDRTRQPLAQLDDRHAWTSDQAWRTVADAGDFAATWM